MSQTKKSWNDKLMTTKTHQVKRIDMDFAGISAGSNMLVATPRIVDEYVKQIPLGKGIDMKTLRNDLAVEYQADCTCPVSTAIFLRTVAEEAYERYQQGVPAKQLTPFWRVIDPDSSLSRKLACGHEFLLEQRQKEVIE